MGSLPSRLLKRVVVIEGESIHISASPCPGNVGRHNFLAYIFYGFSVVRGSLNKTRKSVNGESGGVSRGVRENIEKEEKEVKISRLGHGLNLC
jgi:hypothetical protein